MAYAEYPGGSSSNVSRSIERGQTPLGSACGAEVGRDEAVARPRAAGHSDPAERAREILADPAGTHVAAQAAGEGAVGQDVAATHGRRVGVGGARERAGRAERGEPVGSPRLVHRIDDPRLDGVMTGGGRRLGGRG